MAPKEKWIKPKVMVLVHGKSTEAVLAVCKSAIHVGPRFSGGVEGAYAGWVGRNVPPPSTGCLDIVKRTQCTNPNDGTYLVWQCFDWHVAS